MLRLGMIGTNIISDNLLSNARTVEGVQVQAVYSRREDTGRDFAIRHGIPEVYTDFEAFCSAGSFDAVYVASPNLLHVPQSLALLEHGKHVLCEKPIATEAADYRRVMAAARERRLIYLEAMRPMFDPILAAVEREIGKLGTIRHARLEYCQYSSRYDDYQAGIVQNAFDPRLGNAAVMDIGVYCLFWCVRLFGKPDSILTHSTFLPDGFEAEGSVLCIYGKDRYAEIQYSKVADSVQPSIVTGERGSVTIGPKLNSPACVTTYLRGEEPYTVTADYSPRNLKYEVAEFKRLIEEGVSEYPYAALTGDVQDLLDEIRLQSGIRFKAPDGRC